MVHVVLVSDDKLFLDALSGIISQELHYEVTSMENTSALAAFSPEQVDLVVATQAVDVPAGLRSMRLSHGQPQKISILLQSITEALSTERSETQPLTEDISLLSRQRRLQHVNGRWVELTEKEQALLLCLYGHSEVSREDILKQVWGFAPDIDTHTLETHVYRLRQKWSELTDYDAVVATASGYGWYER